ncbi:MAG TPA: phosphomannomutase/phosphoglucomutase [Candidatus Gracilibacteria bacterium]
MILNETIFRAYDIRGKADMAFDAEGFYVLGKAIITYVKKTEEPKSQRTKVFVSGDGRLSMPDLYGALIKGLEDEGCLVTRGGMLTTPLNYFAFHEGDFDLGLQISASHNPWHDNGLKLTGRRGAICGDQIQEIKEIAYQLMEDNSIKYQGLSIKGMVLDAAGYADRYIAKLKSVVGDQAPKKIVLDSGNAIPGSFYPEVLRSFGHEIIELYCDLDARFPNHQPDPEEAENVRFCQGKVLETGADFGLSFDGDGDRVGVVLRDGTLLNADKILYVLAADMLSRNPGEKVVVDAMSSDTLASKIRGIGGTVIRSKTGHSFIEEAMEHHHALLGGEQSGHFMFGENFYGHDDAALASLRFLGAVESDPTLIKDVTINWPKMREYAEKFVVDDTQKFQIMENYVAIMKKKFPEADTIDGIRISFGDDEWAIVRPSNTSPKISVRIEGVSEASLEAKKEVLVGALQELIRL